MLAGYLPFDDDPANPEGDNINLLYKYIVSTPLTFPEYVTPHARDLLKRILVPDPRKRADLFEVARHSWLSDYAHVVSFITSSTTTPNDIAKTTVLSSTSRTTATQSSADLNAEEDAPMLARSASVREPGKPHAAVTPVGGLTAKRDQINRGEQSDKSKSSRDNKRRTVQVEYVAPQSQTVRGEASPPSAPAGSSKSRVNHQGPTEVPPTDGYQSSGTNTRQSRPTTASNAMGSAAATATRPTRETQRSVSDYTAFGNAPVSSAARPSTGGTLGGSRLPSRGNSYGQPVAATVAQTNAEGRFSQPKGKQYSISSPLQAEPQIGEPSIGQPSTQRAPTNPAPEVQPPNHKGHRRSNTVSETIGRVTSIFTGRPMQDSTQHSNHTPNKIQKSYPPTSMHGPLASDDAPRRSQESSRRTSFGFSRKNTDQSAAPKSTRRFSLLPSSLSKTFTRESMPPPSSHSSIERRAQAAQTPRSRTTSRPGVGLGHDLGHGDSRSPSRSTNGSHKPGFYDGQHESGSRIRAGSSSAPAQQTQFSYPPLIGDEKFPGPTQPHPASQASQGQPYKHANDSEASETPARGPNRPQYPPGFNSGDGQTPQRERPGVLQKHRKFADAYEDSKQGQHSGSSGSAKRVMDLFRRLGRQRAKEDR
jgi:protein-serine/threonine kinase